MWIKRITVFVAGLTTCVLATLPGQTVNDSMDGNWAVVNGQKRFLSGMNVAWISFGSDVGDAKIDINGFTDKVKKIRKSGGNALRWWLHTDASHCPKIDTTGTVTGLGSKTIANMSEALDTAYAYGVVVSMCLFSFDLLVPGTGDGKASYSEFNIDNNHKFLTDTSKIITYLNNGLKPILDSIGNHPAVMCWEVFNEPEGMLQSANWSHVTKKITQNEILRITNRIAGFVHRNSKKMVSTGIAGAQYVSEYSDQKLKTAGGDDDGYLDFYMVHYYPEWAGQGQSPFHNSAASWNMDRPVLIGEFPAKGWSTSMTGESSGQPLKTTMTIEGAFAYAYEQGYAGAMSWAMTEQASSFFGDYSTTAPALEALYNSHQADIMIKDVVIEEMSGNYVMKAVMQDVPTPDDDGGAYFELGTNYSGSLEGKDSIHFDMLVQPNSDKNLQLQMVIKVGSDYSWSPATNDVLNLGTVEQGKWLTFSIPVSGFGASSVAEVKEILFQWWAIGTAYTGTIYFDNVRADDDTLFNLNAEGSTWRTNADGASISLVKFSDITSAKSKRQQNSLAAGLNGTSVSMQGKTLNLRISKMSDVQLKVIDLRGQTVARFNCGELSANNHKYSLKGISSGRYIVEVHQGKSRLVSDIIIQ